MGTFNQRPRGPRAWLLLRPAAPPADGGRPASRAPPRRARLWRAATPPRGTVRLVSERDLFANFERMRREMDELFGGVVARGRAPRRRGGFSPAVDVYYVGYPPRAVVRADLAGIDPAD